MACHSASVRSDAPLGTAGASAEYLVRIAGAIRNRTFPLIYIENQWENGMNYHEISDNPMLGFIWAFDYPKW
jgi:hypothetical protein